MTNGIFKQAGKTTADIARQAARQVVREPYELLKSGSSQVLKNENKPPLDPVSQTSDKIPELTPEEIAKKEKAERDRLKELEEELRRMRGKREEKEEAWGKDVEEKLKAQTPQPEAAQPALEPTTKPKRGMIGVVAKKQGTKEMGKQISG